MAWTAALIAAMTAQDAGQYYPNGKYRGFSNSPLNFAAGATQKLLSTTNEQVVVSGLYLDDSAANDLVAVTSFSLPDGQEGVKGLIPASLFSESSQNRPYLGLFYDGSISLDVEINNGSAGVLDIVGGFTQDPTAGEFSGYAHGRQSRVFAVGVDAALTALVLGTNQSTEIKPEETVIMDRLIVQVDAATDINDISLVSLKIGGREFVQGGDIPAGMFLASNPGNRSWSPEALSPAGQRVFVGPPVVVTPNTPVVATWRNSHGVTATSLIACITTK